MLEYDVKFEEENLDVLFDDFQEVNKGTFDHSKLNNRDLESQHPIKAVEGLQDALNAKANTEDVPTKVSQLENDTGYLTEHQSLADYAKKSDVESDIAAAENNTDTKFAKYLPLAGGTATGAIIAPSFQTGTDEANYFQTKKMRGEGDANTYYHAVDWGYAKHDQVDFHEYGGVWNFYKNTSGKAGAGSLIGSIKPTGWNGSAVLTGTPTAPTAPDGTSTTQIATTEFVTKTANTRYSKPVDGIPKSDLASEVQTSLDKADTALQSFTETDPTVPDWAKADTKPTYTAEEVGAVACFASSPADPLVLFTAAKSVNYKPIVVSGNNWSLDGVKSGTKYEVYSVSCTYGVTSFILTDQGYNVKTFYLATGDGRQYTGYFQSTNLMSVSEIAKEDTGNKTTSLSADSTDTQYPSAKCVYDLVGDIKTLIDNL